MAGFHPQEICQITTPETFIGGCLFLEFSHKYLLLLLEAEMKIWATPKYYLAITSCKKASLINKTKVKLVWWFVMSSPWLVSSFCFRPSLTLSLSLQCFYNSTKQTASSLSGYSSKNPCPWLLDCSSRSAPWPLPTSQPSQTPSWYKAVYTPTTNRQMRAPPFQGPEVMLNAQIITQNNTKESARWHINMHDTREWWTKNKAAVFFFFWIFASCFYIDIILCT